MGMRMVFTVFLLVVLAATIVSFTSDRASDGRNVAAKAFHRIGRTIRDECCSNPACRVNNPHVC
uniref:Alpha-conotoxin-like n=1 Tax=Conus geographus TaxID=6491 RepID=X5IGW5_CONGE|nr:G048_VD_Superfamily_A_precursor_conopeptide [Conus geographus]